jgi:electron transport complex protein RnfG
MKLPTHKPFALAILLGLMSVVGISLVSLVFHLSKSDIQANQYEAVLQSLNQILPTTLYDNDIVNDTLQLSDPLLGDLSPKTIYRARYQSKPAAVVITTMATDGYNGNIFLLVAIKYDGSIDGVRVIAHQETPGLGDKIDLNHSDWILGFNQQSLLKLPLPKWGVKKDGGNFDQFTGATVTTRAVVSAVRNALIYYQMHRPDLF